MKKVLVFGAFDGIHGGHRYFLSEAKKKGTHLTVVVAPDVAVVALKGHFPARALAERMADVEALHIADCVVAGDEEAKNWGVLKRERPAIIALGYDQHGLQEALHAARHTLPFHHLFMIDSFMGDLLHSSILQKHR